MSELTLLYVPSDSMGYGRMGVRIAAAVARRGIDVYDGLASPEDDIDEMNRLYGVRRYGKTNTVCWMSVPGHAGGWYEGQHAAIFTMWEADTLPESFRETLHTFDTVIVPSEQNVELFSQYHPNVKLCYLGVDATWAYRKRTPPTTRFNFLIGGAGKRKGTDLAVNAFRKVFGDDESWPADGPVPYLIRKSPKPEDLGRHPRIEVVAGKLTADEERDLYASAHVYLQPSRGEGFGLQPLQAIAQGCPTILTDAHGHAAFAHLGIGLSTSKTKSAYFIYGDAGDWWEPDFDELCEAMWWTYHNYADAQAMADHGSVEAHRLFNWDRTADQFLACLPELGPYTGSGRWRKAEAKLYPARSLTHQKFDAAGINYLFTPGETLYVPADVKRIMFESGTLDPACITADDDGLLPAQIARAGHATARQLHCPTCRQPLNGGDSLEVAA